jgi:Zn-dependent M28 family amino/carboxypeptidase
VAAVNWALDRMRAYGCDSAYADEFDTMYDPSAIGVKVGRSNPHRVFIICGHIDDWCYPPDKAPGADDNASGATAVLEACRVLAGYDFDCTVRFIGFNAEENGLIGSTYYAWYARQRGDSILGALNFDMISHADAGFDSVRVLGRATNPNCSLVVNTYCAMADSYTSLKYHSVIHDTITEGSDHYSFWEFGYPAIDVHEAQYPPSHHTLLDSVGPYEYPDCGTNNIPMASEVIKAAVATLARLAGVRPLAIAENPTAPANAALLTLCSSNPAPSRIRIRLQVVRRSPVRLAIRDAVGRVVKRIADEVLMPGAYDYTWDTGVVPSGVYFLSLETAGCREARKLVVSP